MELAPTEAVEGVVAPESTLASAPGSLDPPSSKPPVQSVQGPTTVSPSQAQSNFEVKIHNKT